MMELGGRGGQMFQEEEKVREEEKAGHSVASSSRQQIASIKQESQRPQQLFRVLNQTGAVIEILDDEDDEALRYAMKKQESTYVRNADPDYNPNDFPGSTTQYQLTGQQSVRGTITGGDQESQLLRIENDLGITQSSAGAS